MAEQSCVIWENNNNNNITAKCHQRKRTQTICITNKDNGYHFHRGGRNNQEREEKSLPFLLQKSKKKNNNYIIIFIINFNHTIHNLGAFKPPKSKASHSLQNKTQASACFFFLSIIVSQTRVAKTSFILCMCTMGQHSFTSVILFGLH